MAPRLCSYTASKPSAWYVDAYDGEYSLGPSFHSCPYCNGSLIPSGASERDAVLGLCGSCGFWRIADLRGAPMFGHGREVPAITALAKEYSIDATELPLADLRRYLQAHPSKMVDVQPRAFELLIRDCLRAVYQGCEVHHVGSTADGGVDLKIVLSDQDPILVQVKRREVVERNEGIDVIRSLNGVLFREGVAKGMVVTSAKGFTRAARGETQVRTATTEPYQMQLHGFDDIVRWLNLPAPEPYQPWKALAPWWNFDKALCHSPGKAGYFTY